MNKMIQIFCRNINQVLCVFGLLLLPSSLNAMKAYSLSSEDAMMPNDTIKKGGWTKHGEWNELLESSFADSIKSRWLVPDSVINGKKYILDRRYRPENDSSLKWYRNLFLQAGVGIEQMVPPKGNYHFDALTQAHGALGIQLNSYHSLRGVLHASLGYQKEYDRMFAKIGGRIDHLFDWTSYFEGYRPDRLFGISSIIGVGAQYAGLNQMRRRGKSFESHVGMQLHFYTGPHGIINLEPYIGVGTDNFDLSRNQNWRRYDVFYGIGLNYVYYFSNHLSRAARMRLLEKGKGLGRTIRDSQRNALTDSVLLSWQAPWIVEYSAGANVTDATDLAMGETLGHNVTFSVGKWFSPVIGLKASLHSRTLKWRKENSMSGDVQYETDYMTQYNSGRVEGMFNPLGFSRKFSWDSPFGGYLVVGGEFGWFIKEQSEKSLHCRSEAYTAGLHLWARLSEGLHVFVEPRFVHNVYKIPYTNVQWNKRFSDNTLGVNLGLTAVSVPPKFRKRHESMSDEYFHHLTVGIGGGANMIQSIKRLKGFSSFPWNAHAFASYNIDYVSGVRLAFEFFSRPVSDMSSYNDYNMQLPSEGYAPVMRNGQWNHNYRMGVLSLGYNVDLANAFAGRQIDPLFRLEGFLGPAIMFIFGEGGTLDKKEPLREGHDVRLLEKVDGKTYFAVNVGSKLSARLTSRLRLTLTPQVNFVPNLKMSSLNMTRLKLFEHLDLGVQYSF